jgi:hypothetical protein
MAWSIQILTSDADLTQYERKMPEQAQQFKGASALSAYDGKRDLAKRDVGTRLVRMGVVLDDLTADNITSLNQTAVYRELSLIFFDLADRADTLSMDKAKRYEKLYEDSWVDVAIALNISGEKTGIGFIPLQRA